MSRLRGPEKAQIRLRIAKELSDYVTGRGGLWLEGVIQRARAIEEGLGGAKPDVGSPVPPKGAGLAVVSSKTRTPAALKETSPAASVSLPPGAKLRSV